MKTGVVIVTHYQIGAEFLHALRLIVPNAPDFLSVSIDPKQSIDEMRRLIQQALKRADCGAGVLVLTDMFGGTPSNMSLSFVEETGVEVVTGLNLPMLIKLATFIKSYGQRNISVASEILPERDP